MYEDKITITDPNYREPMSDKIQQELKEYEDEKLRRAEQKENEMLEASWQRSLRRAARCRKVLTGIKSFFYKDSIQIQR